MIPVLRRFPPQAVTRIPGPKQAFGSKRPTVAFGDPIVTALGNGGFPSGDMINNNFLNTGGQPTWFAISDGGAGYIPWGFWQVAIYPQGELPPGITENLAFGFLEADVTTESVTVATDVLLKFRQLKAQGIAAGFTNAAKIRFPDNVDFLNISIDDTRGGFTVTGPFGLTDLLGSYSGGFWLGQGEAPLPVVINAPGYDTPLLLALWSPGNRAILPLSEPPGPSRYGGYPYPSPPPPAIPEVPLLTAANFEVLAKTGITNVPTSVITGQMGVSPAAASSITGFALSLDGGGQFSTSAQVSGPILAADYAVPTPATMTQAILDMQAAYTNASGRTPDVTGLGGGTLGGNTLTPGVYKWTTGLAISTSITLSGPAGSKFIFIVDGTFTLAAAQQIILTGGVTAADVVWVVAGTVATGATSHMRGTILGQTSISFGAGALLTGKALAQTLVAFDSTTAN